MEVKEFDTSYRFHVTSESRGDVTHLVDLATSECSCEHWEKKLYPLVRKGVIKHARCKHLEAARLMFWVDMVIRLPDELSPITDSTQRDYLIDQTVQLLLRS